MPDWVTHMIFCWLLYQLLVKLRYLSHDRHIEMLMIFGSILPDLNWIYLIGHILQPFLSFYTIEQSSLFFLVFHTPIGAIVIAGIIAQLFDERKKVFLFLIAGLVTHLALDSLLTSITGGIFFLFPVMFSTLRLNIIHSYDMSYMLLALSIFASIVMYRWLNAYKEEKEKEK